MIFEKIEFCISESAKATKIMICIGLRIFFLFVSFSLFTYAFGEIFLDDFTTAAFYADELFFTAKECLGAALIPPMLYEILIRAVKK